MPPQIEKPAEWELDQRHEDDIVRIIPGSVGSFTLVASPHRRNIRGQNPACRACSVTLDNRRFRANIYADLTPMGGFAENAFVSRKLQIGRKAVLGITDRDPRCKMITLDPNTAEASPEVLRKVRDAHEGKAGLYGAVLIEGVVRPGDEIRLLD